ncbi:MAG: protein kinase [Acidobacteriota bacterium]
MSDLSSTPEFGDRFSALRQLSSGALAEVWLAHDNEFDLDVVIKRATAAAGSPATELLREEFAATRRLIHPRIVRVHELHEIGDQVFYTAEWVEGGDLGRLRGGPLTEIVAKARSVAEALEFAHDKGVVHRDLKCSNVLLDEQGQARVSDFGIAGLLQPGDADLELVGGGSGVNESPQQKAGDAPCVADDIYGLGTLLFELITGSPLPQPASDEAPGASDPARPSTWRATPGELDDLVVEMLAAEAVDRPPDMAAVGSRLDAVGLSLQTTELPPSEPRGRPIRAHPPPRAVDPRRAVPPSEPTPRRATKADAWTARRIATAGLFAFLGVVAIAVFFYLPGWVSEYNRRAAATSSRVADDKAADPPLVEDEQLSAPANELPTTREDRRTPPAAADTDASPAVAQPRAEPPPVEPPQNTESKPARAETPPAKPPPVRREERQQDSGQERFAAAMSTGLKALADGNFAAAESSFQMALDLKPGSSEAMDGLGRARQRLRLEAIEQHGERAREYAASERWLEAVAEYRSVLAIDPTIRFAIQGEQEAASRAELDSRLNAYISNPDRLSSLAVLSAAAETLDQARVVEPTGPRIQTQIEELQRAVKTASTPIKVRLVSDNNTEVMVYRVGALGKFEQRQLDLRPGSYTAVGRRDGYRDVRRVFKVAHGEAMEPIVVRCEEKI